jgi:hypothetical protein
MGRVGAAAAAVLAITGAAGAAAAQSGPSLGETLGFIRDKVSQQGVVAYSSSTHDSSDGQTWSTSFTVEASNVTSDVAGCRVDFHWRTFVNGKVGNDGDSGFPLRLITSVAVTTMDEDLNRLSAQGGHPTWTSQVSPSIAVLTAFRSDGKSNVVDFRDRNMAERVANAVRHAADLCGGSAGKEPF